MKSTNILLVSIAIVAFVLGFFIDEISDPAKTIFKNNGCLSSFTFVNPSLGCEAFDEKLDRMKSLQTDLDLQVSGYLDSGRADRISVFTRDLNSQRFAGG